MDQGEDMGLHVQAVCMRSGDLESMSLHCTRDVHGIRQPGGAVGHVVHGASMRSGNHGNIGSCCAGGDPKVRQPRGAWGHIEQGLSGTDVTGCKH